MEYQTDEQVERLKNAIQVAKNIVVLTGAGISVPSGIPDFRSADGLYSTHIGAFPAEVMLSHEFFFEHTKKFYDFYREKMLYPDAKPNAAHLLLAKLEQMGKLGAVVTQNIDSLHTLAGNKKVYELHGACARNYCTSCHTFYDLDYVAKGKGIPTCEKCGGVIKPDVVLYGETLDERTLAGAVRAVSRADLFIVIGTSLNVYPAAGLVAYCADSAVTAVVNKSATSFDGEADIVINSDCAAVAQQIAGELGIDLN